MKLTRSFTLALLATLALAGPLAAQQPWQWSGRVDPGDAIEIKGINGGIRAVASDNSEVRVGATKNARRSDPDEVRFDVVRHAGGTTICAVYPDRRGTNECRPGEAGRMNVQNNDVQVDWVVQVPRGVDFVGRTVNGGIAARDLPADAEAYTVNGGVELETAGHALAQTVNGSIRAEMGRADWSGDAEFETVNGSVTLELPAGVGAEVEASTVNGGIQTDFPLEVTGRLSRRKLSGTIGGGGRRLRIRTVNGGIHLQRGRS
jgi:hypothetical protein